jgi:hypothetical protein
MATRYWVGGTSTWDTTSTTNWSDTSGGTGGASVPTSVDDVVFDANSNSTGSNYALNSATFNTGTGTTATLNSGVAPDGTTTASLITENITAGEHYALDRSIAVTAGTVYTWSFYAKAYTGTARKAYVRVATAANANINIDLTTGAGTGNGVNHISSGAKLLGNGWVRCWVTFVAATTTNIVARAQIVRAADNASIYTGETTAGLYFWGAQFEKGFEPSGYIPTAGTAVNTENNLLTYSEQFDNAAWTKSNSSMCYNLTLYSQQFANAYWDKAGGLVSVVDNFTTAPDGTTTATKWTETAGTGSHHIHDNVGSYTPVIGQPYTMSCYLKQTETAPDRYVQMVFWSGGFGSTSYANFDMQNGTTTFQGAGLTQTPIITSVGNGWYRLSITALATAEVASGWQIAFISSGTAVRAESYTVAIGSEESYYIWGAQVNIGTTAETYTATTNVSLPIKVIAPNGLATAEKLVENTATSQHNIAHSGTITANSTITGSCYIKAGERTTGWVQVNNSGYTSGFRAQFNTTSGSVTSTSFGTGSINNITMTSISNGWYRVTVTGIIDSSSTSGIISIFLNNGLSYTGDGYSGLYIWGAQLEPGLIAGGYIPTTTSAITHTTSSSSAFTVTILGTTAAPVTCRDFTAGSLDGVASILLQANNEIDVYGSLTLPATNLTWTGSGSSILKFKATTTGKTIITNGVTLAVTVVTYDGVGGEWTLGSALTTSSNTMTLTNGSLITNNFNLTCVAFNSNNSNIRSLNLGSSTVTVSIGTTPWTFTTTTNLTFNAGSSSIIVSGASPTFNGGGLTYNNVSYNNTTAGQAYIINGVNTYNNLTFISAGATSRTSIQFGANQQINGTLTFGSSNTAIRRFRIRSTSTNNAINMTVATIATLSDVDFQDVNVLGTSAPWSGTRLGDGGNTTNITFEPAKTVYWNYPAGGSWQTSAWALSPTGAVSSDNFPLMQDTAVITDIGLSTGNTISTGTNWQMGTVDMSARTLPMTFGIGGTGITIYGDFKLNSNVTTTASTGIIYFGKYNGTHNISLNGASIASEVQFVGGNANYNLLTDFITTSTIGTTLTAGIINLNNHTFNTYIFSSSNTNTRSIAFGTGKFVCPFVASTAATTVVWDTSTSTNLTYTGTSLLELTGNSTQGVRQIKLAALTTAGLGLNVTTGSDVIAIATTGGVLNDVDFTGYSGSLSLGNSIAVTGNFKLSPNIAVSAGTFTLSFNATSGTKTITTFGKTLDFPVTIGGAGGTAIFNLIDSLTIGSSRTTSFTAGTLNLNNNTLTVGFFTSINSNTRSIGFGTGSINVTGNAGTVWSTTTGTNLTITGSRTVNFTYAGSTGSRTISGVNSGTATENNVVDFNIIAGSDVLIFGGYRCRSLNFTGFSGSLNNTSIQLFGSLTLSTTMTPPSSNSVLQIGGTVLDSNITTNGVLLDCPVLFNGTTTVKLIDALTIGSSRTLTMNSGTLDTNNKSLTVGSLLNTGASPRSILIGNNTLTLTGSGTVFDPGIGTNLTLTGNYTISLTSAIAKIFNGGGLTYNKLNQGGSGSVTITGDNTFNSITNTIQPTTVTFTSGSTNSFNDFKLSGTNGNLVTINSSTAGTAATLRYIGSNIVICSYLNIQDSIAI